MRVNYSLIDGKYFSFTKDSSDGPFNPQEVKESLNSLLVYEVFGNNTTVIINPNHVIKVEIEND